MFEIFLYLSIWIDSKPIEWDLSWNVSDFKKDVKFVWQISYVKIYLRLTITRYVSWNKCTCASCQDTVMQKYPTL